MAKFLITMSQLVKKFLTEYFTLVKITKLKNDIHSFQQMEFEILYEAWERYKELLRKCPQHGILQQMQIQIFYNGLNLATKQMLSAAAGGSLCSKQLTEASTLIDDMTSNGYQWNSEKK